MHNDSDRFFVLTGRPGSGKATLIEALRAEGCATAPKAGRGIIRDQMAQMAIGSPGTAQGTVSILPLPLTCELIFGLPWTFTLPLPDTRMSA